MHFFVFVLKKTTIYSCCFLYFLLENNITLPNHLKVEFCRMLDRKDGAYGVVLCELFPPQRDKKVHQLVFKYEKKKSKLTIEKWKKIFQKCNILDDFYEAVRKHAGQEPWSKYNKVSLPLDFYTCKGRISDVSRCLSSKSHISRSWKWWTNYTGIFFLPVPNFNRLFQLVLTKSFKSELFLCLLKFDHKIK